MSRVRRVQIVDCMSGRNMSVIYDSAIHSEVLLSEDHAARRDSQMSQDFVEVSTLNESFLELLWAS